MASDAPRFIVRPAAEADIEQAALWYELRAIGLGAEFLRAVDVCFEQIRRSPESFQQIYKNARRARIRRPRSPAELRLADRADRVYSVST